MPAHKLTTSSLAILGQLAFRPWPAYELAKAMDVNFKYFWPRAQSHVYAEVKRLAELGLASVTEEMQGERRRSVYAITPRGRRALAEWMRSPPETFALEMEGLVRLFLAPFGTREDLLGALASMEAE